MMHSDPQTDPILYDEPTPWSENVCLSTNSQPLSDEIFCFQYVYETIPAKLCFPCIHGHCTCFLVTEGSCTLVADSISIPLHKGDLLFVNAAFPYTFTEIHQFKYLYISFFTPKPKETLACYGISPTATVFHGFEESIGLWLTTLGKCTENNLSTLTKGLLYFTLALLPVDYENNNSAKDTVISQICSFLERSYGNSELSLNYVCRLYNYHPNYLSRRFHQETGSSFTEYLQNCRIRHAKHLLTNTTLLIQEISSGVGYPNALYFSRVFKKTVGISPSKYRDNNKPPNA